MMYRKLLEQEQVWEHKICGLHANTIQALQNKEYEKVIANLRKAVPFAKLNVVIGTVIKPLYTCQQEETQPDAIVYCMLELATLVDCKMMTFVKKLCIWRANFCSPVSLGRIKVNCKKNKQCQHVVLFLLAHPWQQIKALLC